MEKTEFITRMAYATVTNTLDKYVVLKEDDFGRYIEYAFQDGAPHDNRCLSWYDKLQPNALKRNGHDVETWPLRNVGEIYKLRQMSCGNENLDGAEHCSAGHPKERCRECQCKHWTYDEPVKCACWLLAKLDDVEELQIPVTLAFEYAKQCETLLEKYNNGEL